MKFFKAYTQKDWNAEKFYIENENEKDVVFFAETVEEAMKAVIEYIYETSLYDKKETADWIENNPIYLESTTLAEI